MSESANVEVLSAEVRVLQVGNRQITRSMYRQLDEATFEWFRQGAAAHRLDELSKRVDVAIITPPAEGSVAAVEHADKSQAYAYNLAAVGLQSTIDGMASTSRVSDF
jgi:hypothetical protein